MAIFRRDALGKLRIDLSDALARTIARHLAWFNQGQWDDGAPTTGERPWVASSPFAIWDDEVTL
jgi:hypothetical protein